MGEEEILCVGRESVMCINTESTQVQSVKRSANPLPFGSGKGGINPSPRQEFADSLLQLCSGKYLTTGSPEKKKHVNECIYKLKFYCSTQFTNSIMKYPILFLVNSLSQLLLTECFC